MSVTLLRQLLMKEAVKKSAGSSGIMTINKNIAADVEKLVQKYVSDAMQQGVDLDTLGPEQLKMIVQLNKPKTPQIFSADSPEGQDMTKKLMSFLDRQSGDNVVDLAGKKIDTSQGIMGGKSVKELMESGQVQKGTNDIKISEKITDRDMFNNSNLNNTKILKDGKTKSIIPKDEYKEYKNDFDKEILGVDTVADTISYIKTLEPVKAMKEANSIIGRKGKYKDLTPEQSKRILQDTEDHIFQRDPDNLYDYDPEDMATGGRAGFQQGGLPAVDSRMNLDYNTLVEQNTDPMLQALKSQNTSSYRAPPVTSTMTMGPINLDDFESQNTNPPSARILPMPSIPNNEKTLIERSQPGSLEEYLSGYEKYKSTNPNTYVGTQALIDATLPGGIDYTFNSSPHASHFNDYLESIGLSPYQKNLNAISKNLDPEKFNKGGRAGFYTGGITDVEPSLDDIGHGADAMNARTRLMSPGNQATTSTGLNYLLAEDNDNMRIPFAGGGGMSKRAFLKLLASLGGTAAAFKTGILGLGEGGAKKAVSETVKQAAGSGGQVPPYFLNLVKKIKNLGDDVTETGALTERQTVKRYKDFELTEDKVTGRQEITRMKVDGSTDNKLVYDASEYYGKPLTEETYMSYTPGENIIGKGGKPVKTQPEYEEGRALLRNDRGNKGEIVEEIEGVSDDVIKEGTIFEDTLSEFGKADGGRIGYGIGGLSKLGITGSSRRFLEKVFGKEKFNTMIQNDPRMHRGMLEVVEMFRNKDKDGLKMYLQKFMPNMDDTEIEKFIVGDSGTEGISGQLIRLGSGREYQNLIKMSKEADQIRKLDDFDIEDVSKNAEGGRIGLFLGGRLTAGTGLAREMLKFLSKNSADARSPSELLKLYNPKQFGKLLNNPKNTGKISPETGETADEMILDLMNKMKNDRSSMVGDLIGSARKIKKVDDNIIAYKQKIIKDMIDGGIDEKTARSFAEQMGKEMKNSAAPLLESPPKITEQGLLELENIQKNLMTKDRKLQATGGLTTMLGE